MKKFLFVAALALALGGGQAVAKTYQPHTTKAGGYQTQQTEPNRYVVVYTGAKGAKKNQVAQFALLRAAELAVETGNEWFAVISSSSQQVDLNAVTNTIEAGGSFLTGEAVGTGSGGAAGGTGRGDPTVGGGGTFGGFGGGDVPYQAMERWRPVNVHQTIMIIQVGSGDGASFPGAISQPEIFDAKATVDEIRATMK